MTAAPVKKIWLNGEILAAHEARIAPDDRGFLLADGVFETALMVMGEVYWLADHLARLRDAARVIGIDLPAILRPEQQSDLTQSLEKLWRANGFPTRAALRVTLTRGVSHTRGIWPPSSSDITPTVMAAISPLPPIKHEPIHVMLAQSTRRNEFSPLSRIKSLGYGDAILARREAVAHGANDAVLLNCQGNLACSTVGNVFLRVHGEWLTPDLDSGILPGLARARLIPILSAKAAPLPATLWQNCDGVLICNSLGLTSVHKIDQRAWVALDAEFLGEIESKIFQV